MDISMERSKRSFFEFFPFLSSNETLENVTIDVVSKGCFGSFDTVACIRNGILSLFVSVTFLLCLGRIITLHVVKHPQIHQFYIFYFASIECVICATNWVIGNHLPQLDLSASYLKLMQFIVVCHLHWTLATRILHKEKLVIRVIVPILVLYFVYFTSMTVIGIISVKSSWTECLEPDWIMLSFIEFLVVQLFMLAGIYITKKINAVSTVDSFKRAQKRDLWSVICAFEVSALVSVIYDITMLILGSEAMSCSAIFGHMQLVYSPIFALFMILKLMLPIWVMLCVFHPVPLMIVDPETVLGWSFEGTAPTSVFSPAHRERSIYKQLQHPGTNSGQSDQTIIIEQPQLSRSQTSPAFFTGLLKRGGQPTSLAPIKEEGEATITVVTQPTPCPDKPPERGRDEQPLLNSGSSRNTESSSVSE